MLDLPRSIRSPLPISTGISKTRLWSRYDTEQFINCNSRSKGRYLRYTKNLIVEDERITEEHYASHFDAITVPSIGVPLGKDIVLPKKRYRYLGGILQMIPANNKLLQFRYFEAPNLQATSPANVYSFLSRRYLNPKIGARLTLAQNMISELQLSLVPEPDPGGNLSILSKSLKCLDIHIMENSYIDGLLDNLGRFGENLERLSLSAENGLNWHAKLKFEPRKNHNMPSNTCPNRKNRSC
jgi:hypothetical protein